MGLFASNQREIWQQFAEEAGGEYIDGGFFKKRKVVIPFENWIITLDTFTRSTGKTSTTYTRMTAPYKSPDGLIFQIYRKNIFSKFGKVLGMQDIEIGDSDFDDEFVVKGNDEKKIIELLSSKKIRELISSLDNFLLKTVDRNGWFNDYNRDGIFELYFESRGVIKDIVLLRNLFMLFVFILNRLTIVGSAKEEQI